MKKRILSVILGISLVVALVGCGSNNATNNSTSNAGEESAVESKLEGTVAVVGSTSVQPLAQELADAFSEIEPGIQVDIQGVGSSAGVKAANEGTADIGTSSRELKEEEKGYGLTEHIIAYDGIAIVVSPNNTVEDLTTEQIAQIFKGEITNWSEVGGADADILVVSREDGSGTRGAFEELVKLLDENDASLVRADALIADGNGAVKANVASKENAIGYVSLEYLDDTLKAVKVDDVEVSVENIKAGTYKISRPFLMLTNGELNEATQAYLDFIMSDAGQEIVGEKLITVK
ncbi:phosphate ABC transporter substrate-binding protein [Clostridium grantii]|uniref:Phosphate-binding protein n=1 Tax=Clostridium grantii DSM 8605 TaxID=1121316 RepID=A0A1M5XGE6_9CLOT|nr:phosphate ABC transporter substrate-binding protein [Clostridium grantii]SHH98881.1 phosphate ABC transporter substrate-binding protein, PhoT family [Clostridium grantii DSM 8605]